MTGDELAPWYPIAGMVAEPAQGPPGSRCATGRLACLEKKDTSLGGGKVGVDVPGGTKPGVDALGGAKVSVDMLGGTTKLCGDA